MKRKISILLLLLIAAFGLFAQESHQVSSPDGKLLFSLTRNNNGSLTWSVNYNDQPIILNSVLGLSGWSEGLILNGSTSAKKDKVWKPVYGERSLIRDHYQELIFNLLKDNNPRNEMRLIVRAYNEGIAFRYSFPEKLFRGRGKNISIRSELTNFTLPEGTKAWFTGRAQGAYSLLPLSGWTGECERPLVLQLEKGLYACLAEAEMVDYSRTKFSLDADKPNTINCTMYDRVDLTTPFATPWRVIMVAEKPGQLLENNDLILNLNPPCQIANTSWIKPGKIMREVTLSAKGARELVDFAVKRNLQYIHFDAGWYGSDATSVKVGRWCNPDIDLDLQEAIRYANENGIGVFLYVNQGELYKQLDEILPLYRKWGVRGLKFGFVHVGSHRWTTWLHDAVKKCAEYHLMVNIHDEYRPTGFSRTYPNLLTQEGVRGNETRAEATNSTILPFTRCIAGAADHTICYYLQAGIKDVNRVIKTTSGHQLALAVIFYSPLQYLYWYDKPSDSQDEPELEFFDQVPVVWDDTKVLQGEIGQYVTIARRSGESWFVGSVTNTEPRLLKISLDFLPAGKKFEASIYSDDPTVNTRTKVVIKRIKVDSTVVLDVPLAASGGQAIRIVPVTK